MDKEIFLLTVKFPKTEAYGLIDQLRRSVHSIVANIAEGFGRRYYQAEYARFLTFARASCHESREHLDAAFSRNYCSLEEFKALDDKLDHAGRMLTRCSLRRSDHNPLGRCLLLSTLAI